MLAPINGINLYYSETGKIESMPAVLIHGFPFSSDMWKRQTQMLQEKNNFRIITYDLRGHGKSDVGDGQYTLELFVDDLIALLDYLKIDKAVICGFSLGGYIVLRAVERNPERFNGLVLCDTMSTSDSNEARLRRAASIKLIKKEGVKPFAEGFLKAVFAPQSFGTRPDLIDEARKMILSNSPIGICGTLLAMAGRTDTSEGLANINVPTLILVGKYDALTPPAAANNMHDKIPNSKLHILNDAAHMSNMENPSEFNKLLNEFL
ncbi:MAG: pimeloyl-ACP methyl ester carboxylesterase [Candidatus Nitrosomirales archaeon]|jgi:pimeloyl-ACP methyl ester carboxylesterase